MQASAKITLLQWLYLLLAILGALTTWYYNVQAIGDLGSQFTPLAFAQVGFEGSNLLASLAADFWIGSLASLIWMIAEGRRLKMKRIWVYVVLTFAVAWAFSLPLFLFMRESKLQHAD